MVDGVPPLVWVVAGCLFEVSLVDRDAPWRCAAPPPQVTLLAEGRRDGRRHMRFRAEAPGEVELRFSSGALDRATVVRIVPEDDLA